MYVRRGRPRKGGAGERAGRDRDKGERRGRASGQEYGLLYDNGNDGGGSFCHAVLTEFDFAGVNAIPRLWVKSFFYHNFSLSQRISGANNQI